MAKANSTQSAASNPNQTDVGALIASGILKALSDKGVSNSPVESLTSAIASGAVKLNEHGFPIAAFRPAGGAVQVTLVLGMRQRMSYSLDLWDDQGNKKSSKDGVSWDNQPDSYSYDPVADIQDDDHLFWHVRISQSATGAGDYYYLAVRIEQGGTPCLPPFEYYGPLSGTEILCGSLVFSRI
jgi:hypothetical protein